MVHKRVFSKLFCHHWDVIDVGACSFFLINNSDNFKNNALKNQRFTTP